MMKKSLKRVLTAGAAGVALAAGAGIPANAAGIDSDFYASAAGPGLCHVIVLEFYTPVQLNRQGRRLWPRVITKRL